MSPEWSNIVKVLFVPDKATSKATCVLCNEEISMNKSGNTNLRNHLLTKKHSLHYLSEFEKRSKAPGHQMHIEDFYRQSADGSEIEWVRWVIKDNHPLSFVDSESTRKYSKLKRICRQSLLEKMHDIARAVKKDIAQKLGDCFGIVMDGWTDKINKHYYAFQAVTPNGDKWLLALTPPIDAGDLSADTLMETLSKELFI
jgi:hypothetical protein